MKKLNKKGFTLVELLTVMVILITILMIAIPSITAALSRSENKQLEATKQALAASANIKLTKSDFNNSYNKFRGLEQPQCYVKIERIYDKFSESEKEDIEKNNLKNGCIGYKDGDLTFIESDKCETECTLNVE